MISLILIVLTTLSILLITLAVIDGRRIHGLIGIVFFAIVMAIIINIATSTYKTTTEESTAIRVITTTRMTSGVIKGKVFKDTTYISKEEK
jgi:hypothetical protein